MYDDGTCVADDVVIDCSYPPPDPARPDLTPHTAVVVRITCTGHLTISKRTPHGELVSAADLLVKRPELWCQGGETSPEILALLLQDLADNVIVCTGAGAVSAFPICTSDLVCVRGVGEEARVYHVECKAALTSPATAKRLRCEKCTLAADALQHAANRAGGARIAAPLTRAAAAAAGLKLPDADADAGDADGGGGIDAVRFRLRVAEIAHQAGAAVVDLAALAADNEHVPDAELVANCAAWISRALEHVARLGAASTRGAPVPLSILHAAVQVYDHVGRGAYVKLRTILSFLQLPAIRTLDSRTPLEKQASIFIRSYAAAVNDGVDAMAATHKDVPIAVLRQLASVVMLWGDASSILSTFTTSRLVCGFVEGGTYPAPYDELLRLEGEGETSRLSRSMFCVYGVSVFFVQFRAPLIIAVASSSGSHGALYSHLRRVCAALLRLFDMCPLGFGGDADADQQKAAARLAAALGACDDLATMTARDVAVLVRLGKVLLNVMDMSHLIKRGRGAQDEKFSVMPPSAAQRRSLPESQIVIGTQLHELALQISRENATLIPPERIVASLGKKHLKSFLAMQLRLALLRFDVAALAEIESTLKVAGAAVQQFPAEYQYLRLMCAVTDFAHSKNAVTQRAWQEQRAIVMQLAEFARDVVSAWSGLSVPADAPLQPRRGFLEDLELGCRQFVQAIDVAFQIGQIIVGNSGAEPRVYPLAFVQGFLEAFFGNHRGGRGGASVAVATARSYALHQIRGMKRPGAASSAHMHKLHAAAELAAAASAAATSALEDAMLADDCKAPATESDD